MLKLRSCRHGATLTETLAVLVCLLVAMTLILPALAQVGHTVPVTRSMHNLRVLHEALACYAADWNDRQFTAVPDDLGIVGGDCDDYAEQCGCWPPLWVGRDCEGFQWGFFFECASDPFPPTTAPTSLPVFRSASILLRFLGRVSSAIPRSSRCTTT